ncbi:DUF883 family protein [Bartonella sp. F02]|uniref:DUF883 family protein n=1 Tax=Bartonella sp. F02 TaxID=2967262 RepID=UPI0022A9D476|nr:DUF883 C-terminal domain-containing protein [Bartonella sp. F02]MCZ2328842.1 DUF883 C-terminal domain-containing protein [Bartonella sp. F02]
MANNKMAGNKEMGKEKELQTQLKQLRGEIADITSSLSDLGANKLNDTKHKAEKLYHSAKDNGEEIISQAKDKINDFEHYMNHCIHKNPGKSVLFAAGVGFILAQLLRR